jgi:predicted acetyltransferase
MGLDLSQSEIRTPTGEALLRLYEMLMEAFPVDRPVFTEMITKGKRFYTWTPYALYLGEELLGNVSLMPARIWLGAEPLKVVGVASVATRKPYRRKGVAKRLLQHTLQMVDDEEAPAVLFTDLPAVYEGRGFRRIGQTCAAASTSRMRFEGKRFECKVLDTLDQPRLEQLAEIYAQEYPNYDGKVIRDADYWQLYQMLFNLYPNPKIVVCTGGGHALGYARVETEKDRLLVSELCSPPSAVEVTEALLAFLADHAPQVERELITFALPPGHFAWQILQRYQIPLEPEPAGAHRGTFMVRPAAGELLGPLEHLQWSLADKF